MKHFVSVLAFTFIFSASLFSQITISGFVLDAKTNEPLEGVNVYLSETTKGSQTDKDGRFSFIMDRLDQFRLVASSIGYYSKNIKLDIQPGDKVNHTFELKEKEIVLDEILVTASNSEWKSKYSDFKKFFIGNLVSQNDVYIQNPEFIRFEESNSGQEINVIAEAPIKIINHELGYNIEAEFIEVSFNPSNNSGTYKLYTRFSEMETSNDRELKEWNNNRSSAYEGSQTHFFKSLIRNRTKREDFDIISKGAKIEPVNKSAVDKLALFYPRTWRTLSETYTLFELTYQPVVVGHKVKYNQFGNVTNKHVLSYISYGGEIPYILVDSNGVLFDPTVIQFTGKWGLERISLMLPSDYQYE